MTKVERTAPYGNSTATKPAQKAKKSAGANLLTLAFLGSPTWARTRDLRINSPALYRLSYRGSALDYSTLGQTAGQIDSWALMLQVRGCKG
jgi:hypothetical protein